jgi:hypothetical protein
VQTTCQTAAQLTAACSAGSQASCTVQPIGQLDTSQLHARNTSPAARQRRMCTLRIAAAQPLCGCRDSSGGCSAAPLHQKSDVSFFHLHSSPTHALLCSRFDGTFTSNTQRRDILPKPIQRTRTPNPQSKPQQHITQYRPQLAR